MAGGALDLEFAVNLPPGITEAELAERLRSKAGLLQELLAQPVQDVQIGAPHGYSPELGGGGSSGRGRSGYSGQPQGQPYDDRADAHVDHLGYHLDHLNHPTSPIGPGFLRDGSFWAQRRGARISERKAAEDAAKREQEQSAPAPFRARPVPPSVSAPLYQGIQAYARLNKRSRSADGAGQRRGRTVGTDMEEEHDAHGQELRDSSEERRPASRVRREVRDSSEERPLAFRARPVPWCVSAPMYDQMLIEDRRSRQERTSARSRAQMRSSSLPPRLEAVRARLCGDEYAPHLEGGGCGYRASTPAPARQLAQGAPPQSRVMNRPLKAELPSGLPRRFNGKPSFGATCAVDAAENLSRDVAAGGATRAGCGWGVSSVHASSYGISHVTRHKTPPHTRGEALNRANRPYGTTEVPDFAALHEKQRRDRMKYSNRSATQPEPFVFTIPGRSNRARQPPMPKDPSRDPRFHRRPRSARRPQSAPGMRPSAAAVFAAGAEGGSPSVRALERPPVTGPPRTTAKTLQAQQHVASHLTQKRAQRAQAEHRVEQSQKVNPETKARVMRAVGPVESIDDMVERKVIDLKESQRSTMKDKHRDLKDIANRVNRRPLLMEQTDSVARARRLALFQFRGFLKDAGVANPDAHFQEDELDELDRARSDAAAAGGM